MVKCLRSGWLLLWLPWLLTAQSTNSEIIGDSYFDNEAYSAEEIDALVQNYAVNPIIWSACETTDLRALPLRVDLKAALIELHNNHPAVASWQELGRLGNFSPDELAVLALFITFEKRDQKRGNFTQYIVIKPSSSAFDIGKILGRWRQNLSPNFFWGWIMERDAGEPNLLDCFNFSGVYKLPRRATTLIFGAYRVQWGSGLLYTTNLMAGRTNDAIGNLTSPRARLSNYLGSDENRYFFGGAVEHSHKQWQWRSFVSQHRFDATIQDDLVTNLRTDGLHITAGQIAAKDIVQERTIGMGGELTLKYFACGLLGNSISYSRPFKVLDANRQIASVSFYHRFQFKGLTLSGEAVWQNRNGNAFIENLIYGEKGINLALSVRHYSTNYYAPLAAPLYKLGSMPRNEQGIYTGLRVKLSRRLWWSAFVDFYRQITAEEVAVAPRMGCDLLNDFNYRVRSGTQVQLTYKLYTDYNSVSYLSPERKSIMYLRYHQALNNSMSVHFQWQTVLVSSNSDQRAAAFCCYYKWRGSQVVWLLGTTQYYTPMGLMLYITEPGVPLQYNLSSLKGSGCHYFGLLNIKIQGRLNFSASGQLALARQRSSSAFSFSGELNLQLIFDL